REWMVQSGTAEQSGSRALRGNSSIRANRGGERSEQLRATTPQIRRIVSRLRSAVAQVEQPRWPSWASGTRACKLRQHLVDALTAIDNRHGPPERRVIHLVRVDAHEMEDRTQQILDAVRLGGWEARRFIAGSDDCTSLDSSTG